MKTSKMIDTFKSVFSSDLKKLRKSYNKDFKTKLDLDAFSDLMYHSGAFRGFYPTPDVIKGKRGRDLALADFEKGNAFNLLLTLFASPSQFKDYAFKMMSGGFEPPKNFLLCLPHFRVNQIDEMMSATMNK